MNCSKARVRKRTTQIASTTSLTPPDTPLSDQLNNQFLLDIRYVDPGLNPRFKGSSWLRQAIALWLNRR